MLTALPGFTVHCPLSTDIDRTIRTPLCSCQTVPVRRYPVRLFPHMLSEIGQIALTVSDVAKATVFYRDTLGLKFLFSAGPNLAFFAAGSVRLMLSTPEGAETAIGKNSVLYFKVADLAAEHTAIVGRGAKNESNPRLVAKMPDHELWMAFVRDPDGNLVGLMQEKR